MVEQLAGLLFPLLDEYRVRAACFDLCQLLQVIVEHKLHRLLVTVQDLDVSLKERKAKLPCPVVVVRQLRACQVSFNCNHFFK